jgi:hypothetical protein
VQAPVAPGAEAETAPERVRRGRGGGSGAATVASGMSTLIRKTAAGHADRLEAILAACRAGAGRAHRCGEGAACF